MINFQDKNIVHAKSFLTKLRGIYGKSESSIVVIYKCKDVHTAFLKKNLDIAFVDKFGHVIESARNVKPWSRLRINGSKFVLERYSNPNEDWFKKDEKINLNLKGGGDEGLSSV